MGKEDDSILRRVDRIEARVENIEKTISAFAENDKVHTATAYEVKALKKEVGQLKEEILVTIKEHTDKTWELINSEQKFIKILIFIILVMTGVRLGPDILSFLGGLM